MKNKKNAKKYIALIAGLTVLCTAGLFVASVTNVFGMFTPEEPYVEGEPYEETIDVTDEGKNQKGSDGSGKVPVSNEVPAANGVKGSEGNPFVILEIVPEHCQQQLVYLNTDNKDYPIKMLRKENLIQLGIEASNEKNLSLIQRGSLNDIDKVKALGDWIVDSEAKGYKVYTIGGKGEKKEKVQILECHKLFSAEVTEEDILKANRSPEQFREVYKQNGMNGLIYQFSELFKNVVDVSDDNLKNKIINDSLNWKKVDGSKYTFEVPVSAIKEEDRNLPLAELAKKYPEWFQEDVNGREVSEEALNEEDGWTKEEAPKELKYNSSEFLEMDVEETIDENTSVEELAEKYPDYFSDIPEYILQDQDGWKLNVGQGSWQEYKDGYFINVGEGNGVFWLYDAGHDDGSGSEWAHFDKNEEDSSKNQWIYRKNLPDGDGYFPLKNRDDYISRLNGENFSDSELVGGYLDAHDFEWNCTMHDYNSYNYAYEKTEDYYTFKYKKQAYYFEYWGLESTDVLKRSLFVFNTQEECDDFNMKVIAVTPSEINEIAKRDTTDTLDLVERADMFYIASYKTGSSGMDKVIELYNQYFNENADIENLKTFRENDLEWASCYKILVRLCNNPNLPLLLNPTLGTMLKNGVNGENNVTHINLTDRYPHIDREGSLNNLSKLYLLSLQFNMLARLDDTSEGIKYKRTFYNDILPKFRTINLDKDAMEGADKGTATTTGYYDREYLVNDETCGDTTLTLDDKKTCNYLWNLVTFYPREIEMGTASQTSAPKEDYLPYGYLDSFFDYYNVFQNDTGDQHGGGGGDEGNVGIVHKPGQVANSNGSQPSLLGNVDNRDVAEDALNTAYKILNKQSETKVIGSLSVKVQKQKRFYQRLSDDLIMLDYKKGSKYSDAVKEKEIYVKLTITNPNNADGVIKSITLGDKELELFDIDKNKLNKEDVFDGKSKDDDPSALNGYRMKSGDTIIYVPFKLSDWLAGNKTIHIQMQGRMYQTKVVSGEEKKVYSKESSPGRHNIEIAERQLFALR